MSLQRSPCNFSQETDVFSPEKEDGDALKALGNKYGVNPIFGGGVKRMRDRYAR